MKPATRWILLFLTLLGSFGLSKWLLFETLLQPDDTARQPAVQVLPSREQAR